MHRGVQVIVSVTTAVLFGVTFLVSHSAAQDASVQVRRNAWTGVYSAVQADRGSKTFRKACGYCHRDDLLGDYGPPLIGVDFTYPWDGRPLSELYETMTSSMPPASAVDRIVVSPQDYVDIITFILRENGLPPGDAELPADTARLREIVFTRQATP